MTPWHLLVVSYFHPPFPTAGGNRWVAMARHLREQGHRVTVVASDAFGGLPDDVANGVVRARDLKSARLLRRVLGRGHLTATGGGAVVERPAPALLTKVFVPDAHVVSWLPAVVLTVRRLVARGDIDCLVTSGPPDSAHLVGLVLGRTRPAWIADFRDGWTFEPLRQPFPTAAQRRLDEALERRVAGTAELVVGATQPIADDLSTRLRARTAYVPNGWDPTSEPLLGTAEPLKTQGSVTLVHTGTLSGGWGRNPEPLLRALRIVRDNGAAPPFRLIHAGRITTEELAAIKRHEVADIVECLGTLDRPSALGLQRRADALVLLTSRNASEASSKLFEYLVAGRPILALAEGNEAARIVQETNTGVTVPPDDVDAIADALRAVADGTLARAYAPQGVGRYIYPAPALAFAQLVDEAIERQSGRAPRVHY